MNMKNRIKYKFKNKPRKLNYGEIHFFYPLIFQTNNSFQEICEAVANSSLIVTQEKFDTIKEQMKRTALRMKENLENEGIQVTNDNICGTYDEYLDLDKDMFLGEDIFPEIYVENDRIKTLLKSQKLEAYTSFLEKTEEEIAYAKKVYGERFLESHDRFSFIPFKVKLESGEMVWVKSLLYLFKNNMAILKLELPLINIDLDNMFNAESEKYVVDIEDCWGLAEHDIELDFSELHKIYINELCENLHIEIWEHGQMLTNKLFIDYEGMPRSLKNIDSKLKEDLFRTICAPVLSTRYPQREIEKYIEERSYGIDDLKFIAKTTGGGLTIIGADVLKSAKKSNNSDRMQVYNQISRSMSSNVEYAILVTILRKIITEYDYLSKKYKKGNLIDFRRRHNQDIIFFCNLQEAAFGSAKEQATFFKDNMPHYFAGETTELKQKAVDTILNDIEREQAKKFQDAVSKGGIIFTIVFSLPAINESVRIIRNACWFIDKEVPIVTVDIISFILWVILVAFVLLYFKKNYRSKEASEEICEEKEAVFTILFCLGANDYKTIGEIYRRCNFSKSYIRSVLDGMVVKGLVDRKVSIKGMVYKLNDL